MHVTLAPAESWKILKLYKIFVRIRLPKRLSLVFISHNSSFEFFTRQYDHWNLPDFSRICPEFANNFSPRGGVAKNPHCHLPAHDQNSSTDI